MKRVKGERHYLIKIAIAGVFTLYMEGGQYLSEIVVKHLRMAAGFFSFNIWKMEAADSGCTFRSPGHAARKQAWNTSSSIGRL